MLGLRVLQLPAGCWSSLFMSVAMLHRSVLGTGIAQQSHSQTTRNPCCTHCQQTKSVCVPDLCRQMVAFPLPFLADHCSTGQGRQPAWPPGGQACHGSAQRSGPDSCAAGLLQLQQLWPAHPAGPGTCTAAAPDTRDYEAQPVLLVLGALPWWWRAVLAFCVVIRTWADPLVFCLLAGLVPRNSWNTPEQEH